MSRVHHPVLKTKHIGVCLSAVTEHKGGDKLMETSGKKEPQTLDRDTDVFLSEMINLEPTPAGKLTPPKGPLKSA